MIIPAAMFIESAADTLKDLTDFVRTDQVKELHTAMGAATAQKLGLTFPLSAEVETAYALGLQTARTLLSTSAPLLMKQIDPKEIL